MSEVPLDPWARLAAINRDGTYRWRAFDPYPGEPKRALGPAPAGWNLPPGAYHDEEQ